MTFTPPPMRFHETRGTTRASARRGAARMKAAINNANSPIVNPTVSAWPANAEAAPAAGTITGGYMDWGTPIFNTTGGSVFGSPGVTVKGVYLVSVVLKGTNGDATAQNLFCNLVILPAVTSFVATQISNDTPAGTEGYLQFSAMTELDVGDYIGVNFLSTGVIFSVSTISRLYVALLGTT